MGIALGSGGLPVVYNGTTYTSNTQAAGAQAQDRLVGKAGQQRDDLTSTAATQDLFESLKGYADSHPGVTLGEFKSFEESEFSANGMDPNAANQMIDSLVTSLTSQKDPDGASRMMVTDSSTSLSDILAAQITKSDQGS